MRTVTSAICERSIFGFFSTDSSSSTVMASSHGGMIRASRSSFCSACSKRASVTEVFLP